MIRKIFLILSPLFFYFSLMGQIVMEKPIVKENDPYHFQSRNISSTSMHTDMLANYDIKYHRLELEVNPAVVFIEGNVTTYFIPTSDLNFMYFDFRNNMVVDSVSYHGNGVSHYFSTSIELKIIFPGTIASGTLDSVTIYYHGVPSSGGFGAFMTATTTCSTQDSVMWTLSEPYGAKNWWPCKEGLTDKIDSVDILITAPIKYNIGSNGVLIARDSLGSKITDHWKHRYPIPAYLIAFAAAEYSIYHDTIDLINGGQLDVLNYVFPCDSAYAHSQTVQLDTVMNFFIDKFGPYPYETEKYGHAQCRFGGGMEHTTMTFMGGWWYYILIHELAHQWFGDKITCGSWHEIWLNEGFATYLEGLTCEQGIQSTTFYNWLYTKRSSILINNFGSVYCDDTTSINRIFSSRLSYNKGAYLLHMLRWVLGDVDFYSGLNAYINDPDLVYDYALTSDFISHMETAGDTTLTEFFNDWYYGEGWPDYQITWSVDVSCNNKLRVNIQQTHSSGGNTFFEMPVPIKFINGTQDTTLIFQQNTPEDNLFFETIGFSPTDAVFDPDLWLCAKSTVTKESVPVKTIHWTGQIDHNWQLSTNWDCGVPTLSDEVVIPAGTPDCIIFTGEVVNCKQLTVEPGAKLITQTNATLNVGY